MIESHTEQFNNWEQKEMSKELRAEWIAQRAEKLHAEFMADEDTFREAMENVMLVKDGVYAEMLFNGLDLMGDTTRCTLNEFFSEYCAMQAKTIAENEADKLRDADLERDMKPKCARKSADEGLITAIMNIGILRMS